MSPMRIGTYTSLPSRRALNIKGEIQGRVGQQPKPNPLSLHLMFRGSVRVPRQVLCFAEAVSAHISMILAHLVCHAFMSCRDTLFRYLQGSGFRV
jgi:hypothetical protein